MVIYHGVELNIHEWDLDGNNGQFEALIILLYLRPVQAVTLPFSAMNYKYFDTQRNVTVC